MRFAWGLLGLLMFVAPLRADPAPKPQAEVDGERLFKQAVAYVANGQPPVQRVQSCYANLEDVKWDMDGSHTEGALRLWIDEPDKYRFERRTRPGARDVTTKLLVGSRMWVMQPNGRKKRMHGTPAGVAAIRQARKDRDQLARIARFLALGSLMGPKVKLVFGGAKTGPGIRQGKWLQIDRHAPDGSVMVFFFAYEAKSGQVTRVLHPGIISVPGRDGIPTEHYILDRWTSGAGAKSLRPARIRAFKEAAGGPKRFLLAHVRDLRINPPMDGVFK